MIGDRLGRRRLLAAVGTGLATGLAGCGYQAAAGDFDWTESVDPYGGSPSVTWLGDGTHLFAVFERSVGPFGPSDGTVHVYDGGGQAVWTGSPDASRHGEPAIADGAAFLPLEEGTVVRLERDGDEQRQARVDSTAEGAQTTWKAEWYHAEESDASDTEPDEDDDADRVPRLALEASESLVAGSHADGVVGFDATDGTELFHLEFEDGLFGSRVGDEPDDPRIRALAVADDLVWTALEDRENGDALLVAVDADGSVVADVELATTPGWLETAGGDAGPALLLAVDGEFRGLDRNGESAYTVPLESPPRSHDPAIVENGSTDRLYHASGESLTAIDLGTGEREWHRDDVRFTAGPVANADGVYGYGTLEGNGGRGCDLVGVAADGDDWWSVERYEDVDCGDELFLVDDRLVVATDETLYGFRWAPGSRYTLL